MSDCLFTRKNPPTTENSENPVNISQYSLKYKFFKFIHIYSWCRRSSGWRWISAVCCRWLLLRRRVKIVKTLKIRIFSNYAIWGEFMSYYIIQNRALCSRLTTTWLPTTAVKENVETGRKGHGNLADQTTLVREQKLGELYNIVTTYRKKVQRHDQPS